MKSYKIYAIIVLLSSLCSCTIKNKSSISKIEQSDSEGRVNINIFQAIQKEYFTKNRKFATSFDELDYSVWKGSNLSSTLEYKYILMQEGKSKSKWSALIAISNDKKKSSYISAIFTENSQPIFKVINCIGLPNKFNGIITDQVLNSTEYAISLEQCPSEFRLAPSY